MAGPQIEVLRNMENPLVVSIQLDDELAVRLQTQAAARRLSPEQFVVHLLGGALGEIDASEAWECQNRRRLALIRTSFTDGLTAQEQSELQELQASMDQRLEATDDQLLDGLRRLRQATEVFAGNGQG